MPQDVTHRLGVEAAGLRGEWECRGYQTLAQPMAPYEASMAKPQDEFPRSGDEECKPKR